MGSGSGPGSLRSFPAVSSEFEIETELSIFASRMRLPATDFPTHVRRRVGTESKLNTLRDGLKISAFILRLLHREFPLRLYGPLGLLILLVSLVLFAGVYMDYLVTGQVARMPTLVFSLFGVAGSMLAGLWDEPEPGSPAAGNGGPAGAEPAAAGSDRHLAGVRPA